jgi:hypothetical protein
MTQLRELVPEPLPPLEEKYVVFKRADFDRFVMTAGLPKTFRIPEPLESFVLRPQDTFAASAIYGYAHLLQSGLELDAIRSGAVFTDDERARLKDLADQVHNLANEWQGLATKVPD